MSADMVSLLPQLLNIGSTGLKMYGGISQGNEAARVAEQNARATADVNVANAAQVRREAMRREELTRRQGRAAIGKQTAAMAQSGVLDAGTGAGVLAQSMTDAELDALNVRYEGVSKSSALLTDAANTLAAGKNAASAARQEGLYSAIGHLAQGAAGAYGIYAKDGGAQGGQDRQNDIEFYSNPENARFMDAFDNPGGMATDPFDPFNPHKRGASFDYRTLFARR